MKQKKLLSLLLTLLIACGSFLGTTALAATTTVPAETTAAAAETTAASEADAQPQKKSLGKQMITLLIVAVCVGLLASWYGFTTMRYNQEKMDDMTEESRKIIEKMRDE